jgi:hypothetical protein
MHITVPSDEVVIASGAQGPGAAATVAAAAPAPEEPAEPEQPKLARGRKGKTAAKPAPTTPPARATVQSARTSTNAKTYTFVWDQPSFPGTVLAGRFEVSNSNEVGLNLHIFFKPGHKD